ncbi:MAG: sugar transferase [Chitinophagaceae bacterium]|nr:sugar transferase [Chitinophagaceae bacterium]
MSRAETTSPSQGRAIRYIVSTEAQPTYEVNKPFAFVKRAFDVILSSLVLILVLWWLVPILAILIKMDSRGPVFFRQKRVGLNGKLFDCLKFRSIIVNNDADKRQAASNDPRITSLGKFLRFSCIDELPQFLNVLRGDMSIVGPRPHMISDCKYFSEQIREYDFRHLVRPGITGMAQIKGYRGKTSGFLDVFHRFQWDAYYVRNSSLSLDFRLIVQTFMQIFKGVLQMRKKKSEDWVEAIPSGAAARTPFSVVIVAKNGAENIGPLLKSVQGLSDDIIVCDSGTSDKSIELAKQAGAKVFEIAWDGYGETKNEAASHASHDWILALDANEMVDAELHNILLNWSPRTNSTVYRVLWKNFLGDKWVKHSDWSTSWKNRLYNKQTVAWDNAISHTDITSPNELNFLKLEGYLENHAFKTEQEYKEKMRESALLTAMDYHVREKRSTWLHLLLSPGICFMKKYIFRLGFLDGRTGWLIAKTSADYSFQKYWALWKLNHKKFHKLDLDRFPALFSYRLQPR